MAADMTSFDLTKAHIRALSGLEFDVVKFDQALAPLRPEMQDIAEQIIASLGRKHDWRRQEHRKREAQAAKELGALLLEVVGRLIIIVIVSTIVGRKLVGDSHVEETPKVENFWSS